MACATRLAQLIWATVSMLMARTRAVRGNCVAMMLRMRYAFVGGEQLIQGSAGGAKVCVAVVVVARCVGYYHEEDLCWKIEEGRICQLRFDDWRGLVFGSLAV